MLLAQDSTEVGRPKTRAQDWLLCWVLTSGLALSTPRALRSLRSFPVPAGACRALVDRSFPTVAVSFLRHAAQLCILFLTCAR